MTACKFDVDSKTCACIVNQMMCDVEQLMQKPMLANFLRPSTDRSQCFDASERCSKPNAATNLQVANRNSKGLQKLPASTTPLRTRLFQTAPHPRISNLPASAGVNTDALLGDSSNWWPTPRLGCSPWAAWLPTREAPTPWGNGLERGGPAMP